jgi:hypothetical protein
MKYKKLYTYDEMIGALKTWDNGVRDINYPEYWEWVKEQIR